MDKPWNKAVDKFFTDSGESLIVDESGYWIRLHKKVVNQRVESYRYDATDLPNESITTGQHNTSKNMDPSW